jgi:hypothetical protein
MMSSVVLTRAPASSIFCINSKIIGCYAPHHTGESSFARLFPHIGIALQVDVRGLQKRQNPFAVVLHGGGI